MGKDIFEDIISKLEDCHYISDLRTMIDLQGCLKLLRVIEGFHYDDYTLDQWCELSEYVLMKKLNCTSDKEAYEYLKEELKNKH